MRTRVPVFLMESQLADLTLIVSSTLNIFLESKKNKLTRKSGLLKGEDRIWHISAMYSDFLFSVKLFNFVLQTRQLLKQKLFDLEQIIMLQCTISKLFCK